MTLEDNVSSEPPPRWKISGYPPATSRPLIHSCRWGDVESNYSMTMSTKHYLLPWIVRHAAWTVNRYVIHSDGYTSFERRWGRNYERAICEFGETLLYLSPQHRKLLKADLRMQKCIWLGNFRNRRKLRRNGIRRTKGTNVWKL